MAYDLIVRGGTVIDGTGMPAFRADVGVRDGMVVDVGEVSGLSARTIDATDLTVAPGFIDHHTHLDAQLFWDPYGTSEPDHGITSVVFGNCGLSLAPVDERARESMVSSLSRVEAIPRELLETSIPWSWSSFGDFLNALEGRIGINAGGHIGHVAVREVVLGEEACERAATGQEIEKMRAIVSQAMRDGALGFSSNRNPRHLREDGRSVASALADDSELHGLCDVLRQMNSGVIQVSSSFGDTETLARRSRRPVLWQSISHRWSAPDAWVSSMERQQAAFAEGLRHYGLSGAVPTVARFTMANSQAFDEMPTWKRIMFLPVASRREAFAEPEIRAELSREMDEELGRPLSFHRRWDLIEVTHTAKPSNTELEGRSIEDIATRRGVAAIDAFLDLVLDEDFETEFFTTYTGGDKDVMAQILGSPFVLIGTSDAGAHVQHDAQNGYTTTLLGYWVRERQIMTLEEAVAKLTFQVATIFGLIRRGLVAPGSYADLVVFDPETVGAQSPELVEDLPGGAARYIQRSTGIHHVVVNGQPIYERGTLTDALPGHVLRGRGKDQPG